MFDGAHWLPDDLPADRGQVQRHLQLHLCHADSFVMQCVLAVQRREMMFQEAHDVYAEVQRCGFQPDQYTLNSMVSVLAASGALSQVLFLCLMHRLTLSA